MLLTCLFHLRSLDIVIPRYLAESVIGNGWSTLVVEGVRVENFVPFTSNLHSVAFINIKFHLPGEFPLGYRIKVSLQKGGITFGFDAAVEDAIISRRIVLLMASSGRSLMYINIVWGQEQYLGAHQRGQDGRRIATLRKQLSAIFLAEIF